MYNEAVQKAILGRTSRLCWMFFRHLISLAQCRRFEGGFQAQIACASAPQPPAPGSDRPMVGDLLDIVNHAVQVPLRVHLRLAA
jgi:hypothetical protein